MKIAPILLFTLAAATATAAAPGVKPGYWETTSQVTSPIHTSSTEQRCVTAEQVRKFMSCYINHHYTCVCDDQTIAAGKLSFNGQCRDNKSGAKVRIAGAGSYTDTTLEMSADADFHFMGLPVAGKASIRARRLAESCPAEAK